MEFWVLWFIGIAVTIGTAIAVRSITWYDDETIEENCGKPMQVFMNLLVIICIVLVGGIANAKFLGMWATSDIKIWTYILIGLVPSILTYLVGYFVLKLYSFSNVFSQICFILVFIISIVGWTIPISKYNRNIETTKETTVTSSEERNLVYFCNLPVQEVSGEISGASIIGIGGVSGDISTSNELPYWYANEKNECLFGTATASNSKIIFITDNEKPYLEIKNYCTYTKSINHNNGKEDSVTDKEWTEYIFHVPEAIMKYSLD